MGRSRPPTGHPWARPAPTKADPKAELPPGTFRTRAEYAGASTRRKLDRAMELVVAGDREALDLYVKSEPGVFPLRGDEVVTLVDVEGLLASRVQVRKRRAARKGDLGIIPGSMGTRSYIVRGNGNPESFCSCSHGAGRAISRGEARKRITLADHAAAMAGVECRKDEDVLDESPAAYKPIDAVMAAQAALVDIVHELRQVVCVKG